MIPKNGGRSLGERHKRNGETEVAGNNEGLLPNGFRGGKSRILGEFTALDDHLRKHGIRLLAQSEDGLRRSVVQRDGACYDEAVCAR